MSVKLFHLLVPLSYTYTILYDQLFVDVPFPSEKLEELPLKGRYIFLTVWCLFLQTIYFTISFLNDIVGTDEPFPRKRPFIRILRDHVFSIAFPVAMFVTIFFWGFYTLNRPLIMPDDVVRTLPEWINHMMHSMTFVFIVIEMFVTNKTYPSRQFGIKTIVILALPYYITVNYIYFKTNVWVYPFLELLNHFTRFLYFFFTTLVGIIFYILGEKLNSYLSIKSVVNSNGQVVSNGVHGKKFY